MYVELKYKIASYYSDILYIISYCIYGISHRMNITLIVHHANKVG